MTTWLTLAAIVLAGLLSLVLTTLTFSLRDFSRSKLQFQLERIGRPKLLDRIVQLKEDLTFVTAIGRLVANILILIGVLHLTRGLQQHEWLRYLVALVVTGIITMFTSVAIPHALAAHTGERIIASQIGFVFALRIALLPAARLMHAIDSAVGKIFRPADVTADEQTEQEIQNEILSVVEEGEKEGVVDEQEREMIESVIQFRATHVGQVMTARPDIIGLPIGAALDEVKRALEESGHSRVPVYEGSLDHIVGILYARDLLKHLGLPPEHFAIRTAMRPAFYVPETKPLKELLKDFRLQKVHLAIVLDEYGSTAGLVTIEDVLEQIVGDISDEHEPQEPAMIRRINEQTFEVDTRVRLEEFNRNLNMNLPEDAGYETLGGFVSTTLGRVPQPGVKFEHSGMRFTILDAEPQRVSRVMIELIPQPAEESAAGPKG